MYISHDREWEDDNLESVAKSNETYLNLGKKTPLCISCSSTIAYAHRKKLPNLSIDKLRWSNGTKIRGKLAVFEDKILICSKIMKLLI